MPSSSVYGHTGVVLKVNSDGSCVIFDGNYDGVTNSSFEATKHDCGTRTIRFPAGSYFACPIEPKK
jgi:surface antigen